MHTRKRHSELYHELNQKFHTLDRYRAPAAGTIKVSSGIQQSRALRGAVGSCGGAVGLSAASFCSEKSDGASHQVVGRRAWPL